MFLTCSGSNWVLPSWNTKVSSTVSDCETLLSICCFSSVLSFPESFTLGSEVRYFREPALDGDSVSSAASKLRRSPTLFCFHFDPHLLGLVLGGASWSWSWGSECVLFREDEWIRGQECRGVWWGEKRLNFLSLESWAVRKVFVGDLFYDKGIKTEINVTVCLH